MTLNHLLLLSALCLGGSLLSAWLRPRLWLIGILSASFCTLSAACLVLLGAGACEFRSAFSIGGEALHLRMDGVSAVFLLLLSLLAASVSVYAQDYWPQKAHPRTAPWGRFWLSLLFVSIVWIFLTANGLHFLIAWELFTVSAYFLITLDRRKASVREAGWLYLVSSHAGTLFLFSFFSLLAMKTGTWELGPINQQVALAPLFWLAFVGFGIKAGFFPLHFWLPSAHASAPSHVSAIMSGIAIKLGIYGLVRFSGWMSLPEGAGLTMICVGVLSAVLGVAFALAQHDLKRLLAYHSVENIGIILIGLGFAIVAVEHGNLSWGRLLFAGALLHVVNHGLFKALLFLGAGSVLHSTGTREMSLLGGLWRQMPWTAGFFALGAAAISGLPPLNGFVSEWLIFLGLFDSSLLHSPSAWLAIPAAIGLGVTGALALACFIKVCGVVFLGAPRSSYAQEAHEGTPSMRVAMGFLAGLCLLIGLLPTLVWCPLATAMASWNPAYLPGVAPEPLAALGFFHLALGGLILVSAWYLWRKVAKNKLQRGPTWDCAYSAPTARMQYSAGSFARTLNDWFACLLRPQRFKVAPESVLPGACGDSTHTPETVLECVLEPAGRGVLFVSTLSRRLQHGKMQAYILYLLLGLFTLTAFVALAIKQ